MDSSGDIWKIIYLGFEKSQRSVTHDILRYINILTYLLTTDSTDSTKLPPPRPQRPTPVARYNTVTDNGLGADDVCLQSVSLGGWHSTTELHVGRSFVVEHRRKRTHPLHAAGDVRPPVTCHVTDNTRKLTSVVKYGKVNDI